VADVQEFQNAFDAVAAERSTQQGNYDSVVRLADELSSNNIPQQPAVADVTSRWNSFLSDLDSRRDALAQELARQQSNENLRVQFAEKAKSVNSFIHEQSAAINSPGTGSLQDQLSVVQARRPVITAAEERLREVEHLAQQLESAGVTSNPHTDLTYPALKANYQELAKVATNKETLIQKEILRQTNANVTAEQLAEYKEVFEHFDKDRTGFLDRLQFKSSLQSIGEDFPDAELDRIIAQIGTNGRVGFEAFVSFVSSKAADSETKPQILEAFRTLAGDKDFVTEEDLRRALPADKVNYLVKNMPLYKGQAGSYDYSTWSTGAFA